MFEGMFKEKRVCGLLEAAPQLLHASFEDPVRVMNMKAVNCGFCSWNDSLANIMDMSAAVLQVERG